MKMGGDMMAEIMMLLLVRVEMMVENEICMLLVGSGYIQKHIHIIGFLVFLNSFYFNTIYFDDATTAMPLLQKHKWYMLYNIMIYVSFYRIWRIFLIMDG